MNFSLTRDKDGKLYSFLIHIPIPFGHGWKLSYIIFFAALQREVYGLVEAALMGPKGSLKIL